jgi:Tol biopolymer transport system component
MWEEARARAALDRPHPEPRRSRIGVFALSLLIAGIVVIIVARLVPLGGGPAPAGTATPSQSAPPITTGAVPPHGSIVFDEFSSLARVELAFIVLGTSGSTPMTDASSAGLVAGDAAWSSDGSRVAFVVGQRGSWRYTGDGDVYVMNADGSDLHQLTHGFGVTSPTWSPDGAQLAFVRNQGSELCTINADGSGLRVIARAHHYYQLPRWSPLGNLIAFQSDIGDIDHEAIFTVQPDGTHLHRLTPVDTGFPSWSPDGRQLAYRYGDRLMLLEMATGKTRPLTTCSLPCVGDFAPSWAPTGAAIAFIRQEDGGAKQHLYVIDLASRRLQRLGDTDAQEGSPTWRP